MTINDLVGNCPNNNKERYKLWISLLSSGAILTFEGAGGAIITAGPNRTAVPDVMKLYSFHRYGGDNKWRGTWEGTKEETAMRIIEHIGRKRPVRIVTAKGEVNR